LSVDDFSGSNLSLEGFDKDVLFEAGAATYDGDTKWPRGFSPPSP